MRGDDASCERQAEPGAAGARRDERLEDRRGDVGGDARPVVGDLDDHATLVAPGARLDGGDARSGRADGVLVEHVETARQEPLMCANLELSRNDAVVVRGAVLREILPCLEDDLDEQHGLGMGGLPAREGHEIVHDSVREAGATFDLGDLWGALR